MKRIVTFLIIVFCIFIKAEATEPIKTDTLKVGDNLPGLRFVTDKGKTLTTDSLKGKTTMLVFFATWCPSCLEELPHVQKEIWDKFSTRKDFALLVIGREHKMTELVKFKKKKQFTFPVVADTKRDIYSLFAPQYIPRTYLINKQGKIILSTIGFNEKEFGETKKKLDEELKR